MTCHLIIRVIAAIAVVIPASLAFAIQPEPMGDIDQSFLLKAVEGQHAEVAFGQSAIQKASDDQVKQYGARMIQDHEKASQEGRQLAAREGVRLPSQLSMEH
jgi:putative membrane protein